MNKPALVKITIGAMLIGVSVVETAQAAEVGDLEVTIDLIAPDEKQSVIMMDRITLPTEAAEQAQARASGLDTANQARENSKGKSINDNRQDIRDILTERGRASQNSSIQP